MTMTVVIAVLLIVVGFRMLDVAFNGDRGRKTDD